MTAKNGGGMSLLELAESRHKLKAANWLREQPGLQAHHLVVGGHLRFVLSLKFDGDTQLIDGLQLRAVDQLPTLVRRHRSFPYGVRSIPVLPDCNAAGLYRALRVFCPGGCEPHHQPLCIADADEAEPAPVFDQSHRHRRAREWESVRQEPQACPEHRTGSGSRFASQ